VALGEKKSELPYSAEDRTLLAAVAAAAGMALALHGADRRAAEERTHRS
jgi:hypothetical protein